VNEAALLNHLKQNPFVLAPMAGITDCGFRSFMRQLGCGVVVTELVSATGLKFSSERTKKLMQFEDVQHPIGIQLFGEELADLDYAAKEVEQMGADFVDLNFGCPVPKVVKKGAGSAVLKDLPYMTQILKTVKAAVKIPVTIKVRTGWDAETRNTHEVAHIAAEEGITWVAIHGRTRAQAYTGLSDWDYISQVKAKAKIPILGNGDIASAKQANERLQDSGCDGVLIGRGALKNPWIFLEATALLHNQDEISNDKNFSYLFDQLWESLSRTQEPRMVGLQIKKLSAWYSAGYPNSTGFRKKIFTIIDPNEALLCAKEYFAAAATLQQADTSHEPFLMGGHG